MATPIVWIQLLGLLVVIAWTLTLELESMVIAVRNEVTTGM
jgi:hypothetical protein